MTDDKPSMLTQYDRARSMLERALNSSRMDVVLASRDDLDHVKLHARKVRDRTLLADAYEFQIRVERHLGTLLETAEAAGVLRSAGERGPQGQANGKARLREIGISWKLSANSRRAAALDQRSFDSLVADMRNRITAGKPKLVSAIYDADKRANASVKRAAPHTCFSHPLADGTPLGQVKLGKLRSRIDQLGVELKILKAIDDRVGSAVDTLAAVEDSVSEAVLDQIIKAATR